MLYKKFLLIGLIFMAFCSVIFSAETFENQIAAAKDAGFLTEQFSHKSERIAHRSPVLKLSFPTETGVRSGYYSLSLNYNGEKYYLSKGVVATYEPDEVNIEARFLIAGDYDLSLTFYPKSGGYASLNYKVEVSDSGAVDKYPEVTTNNFPVLPTGYFYEDGLRMKNFDQQYFFNTVEKSWTLNYRGEMPADYRWVVQRPGSIFDEKNIQVTKKNANATKINFDFPEVGVYQIFLYDNKYKELARWKVRNEVVNEKAQPGKMNDYFDKTRSLDLALMVQDIPFEWEMNVETLAKNLRQGASDQFDLSEIVFDWVTQNISYDHYLIERDENKFIYPAFSRNSTYRSLFSRTCICANYSELSTEIAQKMGLDDYYVDGPVLMSDKQGSLDWSGHAWNAVKLGGKWHYYDTTWGIYLRDPGNFQSTRGIETYRKFWLDINYPSDASKKSGLTISADKAYIEKLPYFGPYGYLIEAGVSIDTLPFGTYKINTKKAFNFNLSANPGLKVEAKFGPPNSYDLKSAGTVTFANGQYSCAINLQQNGVYRLVLYITNEKLGTDATLEYLVTASDSPKMTAPVDKKIYNFGGAYKSMSPDGEQVPLTVTQKGDEFSAVYAYHGIKMKGKINQNLVVGTWTDAAGQSGWFSFTINEKGDALNGSWGLTSGHKFGQLSAAK